MKNIAKVTLLGFLFSTILNAKTNNSKINNSKTSNSKINKPTKVKGVQNPSQPNQLQYISSGNIEQLNDWVKQVVRSSNYAKYIRAKLAASRAENAASMLQFLPSIDTQFGKKHLFRANGKSTNDKLKAHWNNQIININLLKIQNSMITEMISAGMKSKADLENYWENWSKFCLEEIYGVLIDWIGEKSNVRLNEQIVKSRRDLVRKIEARIQTGTMNISDLYSAQSNLSKAETKLFIVQNKEKVLRNRLIEMAGSAPSLDKIGSIPSYGDWNHNKQRILLGSHALKKEYYTKKQSIAHSSSNLSSVLPSLDLGISFERQSTHYTKSVSEAKWQGFFNITMKHHLGLDTVAKLGSGVKNINAAKLQYFEAIRKTVTDGYQIFAEVENGMQELNMHKKSLNISEKSLKTKRSLFFNDIDLPGRRKVSIDDVIYAENDVSYEYEKFIEIYQKAAKNYFKLMHMRGDIANKIGNRKNINKNFEKAVQKDRINQNNRTRKG